MTLRSWSPVLIRCWLNDNGGATSFAQHQVPPRRGCVTAAVPIRCWLNGNGGATSFAQNQVPPRRVCVTAAVLLLGFPVLGVYHVLYPQHVDVILVWENSYMSSTRGGLLPQVI